MAKKYNQGVSVASARFTKAPMGEVEYSKLYGEPTNTTTFNAGRIIPIYCNEVLPHDTWSMEVDEVVRQATLKVPSMDRCIIDIFAYFVPNRVVNKSWKNVMGENTSSAWQAPKVSLAPLCSVDQGVIDTYGDSVQIPMQSVADYYGFATQQPIPREVLASCHDLKFRGYLEIYNNYFRDQNYQPPIAYSKLNVYNGFLDGGQNFMRRDISYEGKIYGTPTDIDLSNGIKADGSYGAGAVAKDLLGSDNAYFSGNGSIPARSMEWSALTEPLKANKLHDYFTSVLPSPQKGEEVIIGMGETAPVRIMTESAGSDFLDVSQNFAYPLAFKLSSGAINANGSGRVLGIDTQTNGQTAGRVVAQNNAGSNLIDGNYAQIVGSNLVGIADLSNATGVSIADLRMSAAIQQVYEILGRGGSRYTEYINSFFELDIDNPFDDIPTCLGHIRRNLDLYQTAQTSASTEDGTAQGNLAAFGYTSTGGKLFTRTFLEHGYIHVMAVVRHRNIYPALLSRDNFRLEMMDFYQYPLANISEQPVYTREINPFAGNDQIFGYQEAWAEYRMEPDRVSGYMRTGSELALDAWTNADNFDPDLLIADGEWLESNTKEVIARGTASQDITAPQFKAKFTFKITKERPLPTYSMSGLDLI